MNLQPSKRRRGRRWSRQTLRSAFLRLIHVDEWNVGVVRSPSLQEILDQPEWRIRDVEWLLAPEPFTYVADPFSEEDEIGASRIWAEHYSYLEARGTLRLYEARSSNPARYDPTVVEIVHPDFRRMPHVSYPSIVRHGDRSFGLLEMSESGRLDLFEVDRERVRWTFVTTLLTDVPAVDPTLLFHDDRWWLFCTRRDVEPERNLHVFFSKTIEGPWQAHSANPVKRDARSSRPAGGLFRVDGALYRPAQDGSMGYGGGVVINRIHDLTTTHFREEVVTTLLPSPESRYPDGLHTLQVHGGFVIVDGKRKVVRAMAAPVKAVARVRHALRDRS